jgi:hypothetical protein
MDRRKSIAAVAVFGILLAGCSGGGGGGGDTTGGGGGTAITGTVSAPGGTVAFNHPTGLRRMLAEFFGRTAHAALGGLDPVSGATVQLIEIDSSGAQVGPVIATATTNGSGVYTLTAPEGFTPASRFVIRALGAGSNRLDALVTGTAIDVDPATDATRALVLDAVAGNGSALAAVSAAEILQIQRTVEDMVKEKEIDPAGLAATALSAALKTAIQNNEETNNSVNSIASQGVITGTVTGSGPLENITIVVRDFGNWVTRATAQTGALGQYTVNVPPGDYILGALNETATSAGGSEWWTSGGGAAKQLGAEKITVSAAAPVTKDFALDAGGRISGTVTAETGGARLPGVSIKVRDFLNSQSVVNVKTGEDGTYRINLAPGSYYLIAENATAQPYASETYNIALNGGANAGEASRLEVSAGGAITADFSLRDGFMISGVVSDPTTGVPVPVPGIRVRFDDADEGDHATVQRTNKIGQYRLWLRPGSYEILARGQTAANVDLNAESQIRNFAAAVGEVKMVLRDAGDNPLGQAKAVLRDSTGTTISKEASNSDGTVSVYSAVTATGATSALLEIKIDDGRMIGSSIYSGKTRLLSGDLAVPSGDPVPVTIGSVNDLGTIALSAGGVLSGTVTVNGVPQGNIRVQVRNGATGGGGRFVNTSTQIDGSYSVSLPAGTYTRVCAFIVSLGCPGGPGAVSGSGTGFAFVGDVPIASGSTTTQDFAFAIP